MTFRIKKRDHGVLSISNVGSANIVVSYWLYIKHFLEIDMYFDSSVQSSI